MPESTENTNRFYYESADRVKRGPFKAKQLKQLASSGKLLPTDTVWRDGLDTPFVAGKIKGLFPVATTSPETSMLTKPGKSQQGSIPEQPTPPPIVKPNSSGDQGHPDKSTSQEVATPTIDEIKAQGGPLTRALLLRAITIFTASIITVIGVFFLWNSYQKTNQQIASIDGKSPVPSELSTPSDKVVESKEVNDHDTVEYAGPFELSDDGRVYTDTLPTCLRFLDSKTLLSGHAEVTSESKQVLGFSVGDPTFVKNEGHVKVWDSRSRRLTARHKMPGAVKAISIDPKKRRLAIVGFYPGIVIADQDDLEKTEFWQFGSKCFSTDVSFSNDGNTIYITTTDGRLIVFDATTGKQTQAFRVREKKEFNEDHRLRISHDSPKILIWSDEGATLVVDSISGEKFGLESANGPGLLLSDGTVLGCLSSDLAVSVAPYSTLRRYSADNSLMRMISPNLKFGINEILHHEQSALFLLADSSGAIHALDLEADKIVAKHQAHTHALKDIQCSQDGTAIASIAFGQKCIQFTSTCRGGIPNAKPVALLEDVELLSFLATDVWHGESFQSQPAFEKENDCWKRLASDSNEDISFCRERVLEFISSMIRAEQGNVDLFRRQVGVAADFAKEAFNEGQRTKEGDIVEGYFEAALGSIALGMQYSTIVKSREAIWNRLIPLIQERSGRERFLATPVELSFDLNPKPQGAANGLSEFSRMQKWTEEGPLRVRLKNISGRELKHCFVVLELGYTHPWTWESAIGVNRKVCAHFSIPRWPDGETCTAKVEGFFNNNARNLALVSTARFDVYEESQRWVGESFDVDPLYRTRSLIQEGDVFLSELKGNFSNKTLSSEDRFGICIQSVNDNRDNALRADVTAAFFNPKRPYALRFAFGHFDRIEAALHLSTFEESGIDVSPDRLDGVSKVLAKGKPFAVGVDVYKDSLTGSDTNRQSLKLLREPEDSDTTRLARTFASSYGENLCVEDVFIGRWHFQNQNGDIGVFIRSRDLDSHASNSDVQGLLFDPSNPALYKTFEGKFQWKTGRLWADLSEHVGITTAASQVPATSNILRAGDKRNLQLIAYANTMIGEDSVGDAFELVRQLPSTAMLEKLRAIAYREFPSGRIADHKLMLVRKPVSVESARADSSGNWPNLDWWKSTLEATALSTKLTIQDEATFDFPTAGKINSISYVGTKGALAIEEGRLLFSNPNATGKSKTGMNFGSSTTFLPSPKGDSLAIGGIGGVEIISLSGKSLMSLPIINADRNAKTIRFARKLEITDNRKLLYCGVNRPELWICNGKFWECVDVSSPVSSLKIVEGQLFIGLDDGRIDVMKADGSPYIVPTQLPRHSYPVHDIDKLSEDLVISIAYGTQTPVEIIVLDWKTGKEVGRYELPIEVSVSRLDASRLRLVCALANGELCIYNVMDPASPSATVECGRVTALDIDKGSGKVLAGFENGDVKQFAVESK